MIIRDWCDRPTLYDLSIAQQEGAFGTFGSRYDQIHLQIAQNTKDKCCPLCKATIDSIQCGFVHECKPK